MHKMYDNIKNNLPSFKIDDLKIKIDLNPNKALIDVLNVYCLAE